MNLLNDFDYEWGAAMSVGTDSSVRLSVKKSLDNVVYGAQLVLAWAVFKILGLHDTRDNAERPVKAAPSEATVEIIPGGEPAR